MSKRHDVVVFCAGLDTEGEGGCSSHTEGCDGSTGTILSAAVEKTAVT